MFCTNCGKQIPDHVKFCTYCGTKIEQQAEIPIHAPVVPEPAPSYPVVPKKRSKLPMILVIILAVVLMGVGIFVVFKLVSSLDFGGSTVYEERIDPEEKEDEPEDIPTDPVEVLPEEEPAVDSDAAAKEELLTEAAMLAEMGDVQAALELIRMGQEAYGDDPAFREAYDLYLSLMETEPGILTTADLISQESIAPLVEMSLVMRAEADAKWDYKDEIPGNCDYKGYIFAKNPENPDDNRLYLVFVMNATIKDVPIQFVYWVFYNDISFDEAGNVSYESMGTSKNDGYTVKTAFGSYYSYYGLDDYDLFFDKIVATSGLEVVEENVWDVVIEHPVSDTYN